MTYGNLIKTCNAVPINIFGLKPEVFSHEFRSNMNDPKVVVLN